MAKRKQADDRSLEPEGFAAAFRSFMDAMLFQASTDQGPLLERIQSHIGDDPATLPVITEEFDTFEHPNVQAAFDSLLAEPGRSAQLVGVAAENKRYMMLSLSDMVSRGSRVPLSEGPVDYVNFHLAGDRVLSCVQFGLYLVDDDGRHLAALVTGPSDRGGPRQRLRVEILARQPEEAQEFLATLTARMRELNVYKGHVISLSPGMMGMGPQTLVAFHTLPNVGRRDVVLPDGLLERIERQTIRFSEQADLLKAAGRSLKRGILLHGPPGVGKTLTLMYLIGQMPERTVLLTTGRGMGLLQTVAQMARALEPAMIVMEDVDLIAEQRGQPMMPTGPLLFELLNEMDGLRDDTDVIFVLTTNRPDILESALAARPGRVDLVVELPLPDQTGRQRLLELYSRGLTLHEVDLPDLAMRTEGASPAYIKELLRKAALLAALDDAAPGEVHDQYIEAALDELSAGGVLGQRILGLQVPGAPSESVATPSMPVPGFPAWRATRPIN